MTAPILAQNTAHGRHYFHPVTNDAKPSITNIINMKSKPLYGSGLRAAANYAADNREKLATLSRDEAYTLASNPPKDASDPASVGDTVHSWIDRYIKGGPPSHDEVKAAPITAQRMFDRFRRFCVKYSPEFTNSEFTVWSNTFGYAGTADWSAVVAGNLVLADTKTGRQPYAEVAMQVAAIAKADFILSPEGAESPIPQYDRYAVLHLRPMSYTFHPIFKIDEAFQSFLALRQVFDWHYNSAPYSVGNAPKITA